MKKGDQNQSTFSPKFTADENFLSPAAVERNSPKSGAPKRNGERNRFWNFGAFLRGRVYASYTDCDF